MSLLTLFFILVVRNSTPVLTEHTNLSESPAQRTYSAPTKFDPNRNASEDLAAAMEEAKHAERNVLIEVGGEWCLWCHIMDSFYEKNPDLLALRDQNYVLVKVNVSEGHPNSDFLSRFPQIDGVPHIFILDSKGKLIHSEDTSELEEGETYNLERFTKFLERFAPKKRKRFELAVDLKSKIPPGGRSTRWM